ncbi:U2 snRNP-associated SURP motif-containing protein [Hondaea fermentalgiana]|uniref:U2 snRNP-associated SURP motif-containing protein n=1 Tax=Hondaea fermentalgiana TaxID=2315210 RepID=A0A2R5GJA1_9STRA|nr:U2 snRNP-associated SURP motif-containing protein [Hondaea fermentalgiana]|eukprot:GBG30962.1 U2 snRNP-associated SURP motif-containing protein [Hondaea fermentalgiana]
MSAPTFATRLVRRLAADQEHQVAGDAFSQGEGARGEVVRVSMVSGAATQLLAGLGEVVFLAVLGPTDRTGRPPALLVVVEGGRVIVTRPDICGDPWLDEQVGSRHASASTAKFAVLTRKLSTKPAAAHGDKPTKSPKRSTRVTLISYGFLAHTSLAVTEIDLDARVIKETRTLAELAGPVMALSARPEDGCIAAAEHSRVLLFSRDELQTNISCVGTGALAWHDNRLYALSETSTMHQARSILANNPVISAWLFPKWLRGMVTKDPDRFKYCKIDPLGAIVTPCESSDKGITVVPLMQDGLGEPWTWVPYKAIDALLINNGNELAVLHGTNHSQITIFSINDDRSSAVLLKTLHTHASCEALLRTDAGELGIKYLDRDEPRAVFDSSDPEDEADPISYLIKQEAFIYKVTTIRGSLTKSLMCSLPSSDTTYSLIGYFDDYLVYHDEERLTGACHVHFRDLSIVSDKNVRPSSKTEEILLGAGSGFTGQNVASSQERIFSIPSDGDFLPGHYAHLSQLTLRPAEESALSQGLTLEACLGLSGSQHTQGDDGSTKDDQDEDDVAARPGVSGEQAIVGYWRFCEGAPMRDISGHSTASQPGRELPDVVNVVSESCVELDPGDGDTIPFAQAARCPLVLTVPHLSKRGWTLEFWFKTDAVTTILVKDLVRLSAHGVEALSESWHHLSCSAQALQGNQTVVAQCLIDGSESRNFLSLGTAVGLASGTSSVLELLPQGGEEAMVTEVRVWNCARSAFEVDMTMSAPLDLAEERRKKFQEVEQEDPFAESSGSEAEAPARPGAGPKRRRLGAARGRGFARVHAGVEQGGKDRVRSRLEGLREEDEHRRRRAADLARHFESYGPVEAIRLEADRATTGLETAARLLFAKIDDAERAFLEEKHATLQKRTLKLSWVKMPRDMGRARAQYLERRQEEALADGQEDDLFSAGPASQEFELELSKESSEPAKDPRVNREDMQNRKEGTGAALERAKDDAYAALLQRERSVLADLLSKLDDTKQSVARIMFFCITHADAAKECYTLVSHELLHTTLSLLVPTRAHRLLFVLSDLLFNSNASVAKAAHYRTLIEADLGMVFARLGQLLRRGRAAQEQSFSDQLFEGRVMAVLQGWERRITFSAQFLAGLRFSFRNEVLSLPITESEVPFLEAAMGPQTLQEVKATCLRLGLPASDLESVNVGQARLRFAQEIIARDCQDWNAPSYPSSMDGESLTSADLAMLAGPRSDDDEDDDDNHDNYDDHRHRQPASAPLPKVDAS